jgi:hypothetical protein
LCFTIPAGKLITASITTEKLVDAEKLRIEAFDEASRPSMRTIRTWAKDRVIPSYKIGPLVFFQLGEVRELKRKPHFLPVNFAEPVRRE